MCEGEDALAGEDQGRLGAARSPPGDQVANLYRSSSQRTCRAGPPFAGGRPAVRRPSCGARRRPRRRARRAPGDPRPERGREDHALQPRLRRLPRDRGTVELLGGTSRTCPRGRAPRWAWRGRTSSPASSAASPSRTTSISRLSACTAATSARCSASATPRCASARASPRRRVAIDRQACRLVGTLSHGEQRQVAAGDGARRRAEDDDARRARLGALARRARAPHRSPARAAGGRSR